MRKRMQHQGGWAVTFVMVGVVLLAGLVGGIYFLKTRTTDQVAVNNDPMSQTEQTPKDTNLDKKMPESSDSKQDTTSTNPSDSDSQQPSNESKKETIVLPETGPADTLVNIIALTSLTIASVAYLRSR